MLNLLKNDHKQYNSYLSLYFLICIGTFVLVVSLFPVDAFAQMSVSNIYNDDQLKTENNTLFVSGFATEKAKSDTVTISIGVQSTNKSATDALISNSEIANEIISTLKQSGVSDNEISTSQYSIQPNYNYSQYGNIVNTTGFTVSNIVTIQSTNTNKVSQWIDSAVNTGANTINSVEFKISPESLGEVRKALIDRAISDAREKGEIAAKAVGTNILGIKSITVNTDGFNPMPLNEQMVQKSFVSDISSTQVLPGQQQVSVTVQVTYLLR